MSACRPIGRASESTVGTSPTTVSTRSCTTHDVSLEHVTNRFHERNRSLTGNCLNVLLRCRFARVLDAISVHVYCRRLLVLRAANTVASERTVQSHSAQRRWGGKHFIACVFSATGEEACLCTRACMLRAYVRASKRTNERACVRACMRACVRACVRGACVRACVRTCVHSSDVPPRTATPRSGLGE